MTVSELLPKIYDVIFKPVVWLLFAVAFLMFVYGIFQFIKNIDSSDTERETGKRNMIYGVVGMVIMVSVFGIIRIIAGTIGVEDPRPDSGIDEGELLPNVTGGL